MTQRKKLRTHGIETIEQLAASTGPIPGIASGTLRQAPAQAQMQVEQDARPPLANGEPDVRAVVYDTAPLEALPVPDPGDIFFDFEGDPALGRRYRPIGVWSTCSGMSSATPRKFGEVPCGHPRRRAGCSRRVSRLRR